MGCPPPQVPRAPSPVVKDGILHIQSLQLSNLRFSSKGRHSPVVALSTMMGNTHL